MSTPLDILATCDDASISATARIVRLAFALGVDNFVAAKAPNFNKVQQSSTSEQQRVQQELLRNNKKPETSTRLGIWFGTRGSEVQILSPRPYFSKRYVGHLVFSYSAVGNFVGREHLGAAQPVAQED